MIRELQILVEDLVALNADRERVPSSARSKIASELDIAAMRLESVGEDDELRQFKLYQVVREVIRQAGVDGQLSERFKRPSDRPEKLQTLREVVPRLQQLAQALRDT